MNPIHSKSDIAPPRKPQATATSALRPAFDDATCARMSLKGVALATLKIVDDGQYIAPSGRTVSIADEVSAAVDGAELFTPEVLEQLRQQQVTTGESSILEVTGERSQTAAYRLMHDEGIERVVLLNYASARNPGGGFLGGAKRTARR